jgi:hypothetical protein
MHPVVSFSRRPGRRKAGSPPTTHRPTAPESRTEASRPRLSPSFCPRDKSVVLRDANPGPRANGWPLQEISAEPGKRSWLGDVGVVIADLSFRVWLYLPRQLPAGCGTKTGRPSPNQHEPRLKPTPTVGSAEGQSDGTAARSFSSFQSLNPSTRAVAAVVIFCDQETGRPANPALRIRSRPSRDGFPLVPVGFRHACLSPSPTCSLPQPSGRDDRIMHIIGHRKPSAPLPALPIRQKQAARADRFPPYMRARMGKAVERKWVAQASWGWGSPCSELRAGWRTVRWIS